MTPYGLPSDAYHCLLDEQPHYLVPQRLFYTEAPPEELIVNPKCWFSWLGPLPADQATRTPYAEYLHQAEWMVWVEDAGNTALWPYCLGPEFAAWCNGLTAGAALEKELPANIRWVLWQANVLIEPNHTAQRRHAWLTSLAKAAPAFERGFVALPNLIPAFHVGALRRYYRAQTRAGAFPFLNDAAGPRFLCQEEGIARFLQHQLATAISDVSRAVLRPSSCEVVCYQAGARIETQTAPEACDYTLSLCFDTTPEPEAQSPWPLQIDTAEGRLKLWQHLGDALLYRARYIPHARDPLPQGHTSSSLLFHYIA